MPKRIIAGNWKMHKTRGEARSLVDAIFEAIDSRAAEDSPGTPHWAGSLHLVVCPPFTCLAEVSAQVDARRAGDLRLEVGAQDIYPGREGAFTGEISSRMLLDAGAAIVLVGHSERRHVIGEGDELLREKVGAGLESGLRPILCIGETLEQREAGQMEAVLERQIDGGLRGLNDDDLARLWIAYEPVWAIGTGRTATPEQAEEAHRFIRQRLVSGWPQAGPQCPILYGGSVKPDNTRGLLSRPDISGVLVGGASLDAAAFVGIAGEAASLS